jgi:3-dehydroquinate synthase
VQAPEKERSPVARNIVQVSLADRAYDIILGHGLLQEAGALLSSLPSRKICVVTDQNVARLYLVSFMKSLEEGGFQACPPVILPAGESSKSFQQLQYIVDKCLSYRLDRNSTIVALGGGVVGDIAGFAASMLLRGINFIQVPTTLLSQVDSSVGGKTGINATGGKNMVGAFYHPKTVLIDTDVLKTLSSRELKAGYAEILKYALISDPAFFGWLEKNGKALIAGDAKAQEYAIETSCRAKTAIVEADEDERKGIRALLNLGHSFGHALEKLGGYDGKILHGEAVGIGCLMAFEFSHELGLCPLADVVRLKSHLSMAGLMIEAPFRVDAEALLAAMQGDKKNRDGNITLILTKGIGKAFVANNIREADLKKFLDKR